MPTRHRLAVLVVLAMTACLSTSGVALAQYAPGGAIDCDTSTVLAGEAFTCAANGFKVGTTVAVTASGPTTGAGARASTAAGQWTYETTARADGDGIATAVVQTPDNATGSTTVTFAGTAPDGQPRVLTNTSAVTVTQSSGGDTTSDPAPAPADDDAAAPVAAEDDDLAATGTDVAVGLVVVAGLVLAGGILLLVTRRRGRSHIEA